MKKDIVELLEKLDILDDAVTEYVSNNDGSPLGWSVEYVETMNKLREVIKQG